MHIHFRIRRWVLWWFYIGVVCGVVAVVNILDRNLTRTQEEVVLAIGLLHWALGGAVCYFYDSVKIDKAQQGPPRNITKEPLRQPEWHAASDFMLPGGRKGLLPPRH